MHAFDAHLCACGLSAEMLVSRKTEDKIYKVFIDPSGHHGIISLTNGTNYYLHSNQKPKLFSKIKVT